MSTTRLPQLLDSLRQSVASVAEVTPRLSTLTPPDDGLSLLDVKNELLLSYLEHMVFLIVLKLRNAASASRASGESDDDNDGNDDSDDFSLETSDLGQAVVKKLVELRLYLEKGVRPLEDKLRYQVEKALRAAEDVERAAAQKKAKADAAAADATDSDDESGSGSDAEADDDDNGDDNDGDDGDFSDADAMLAASRPNRAAFVRPASSTAAAMAAKAKKAAGGKKDNEDDAGGGGVYRPPKIAPTMMPTTTAAERRDRAARRPLKSATMDEFIADELSAAPLAEVSVGANIAGRGRHMTTATERQREDERREYEERNFVRLPKEGKKARAARARAEGRGGPMSFGGEEWRGIGEGVDRINRLTQRKSHGDGGGSLAGATRALLDKSRKRGFDTTDGPRGSGLSAGTDDAGLGGRFNKRLRHHQMGSHRDRVKKNKP